MLVAFLAADIGFVNFYDLVRATEAAGHLAFIHGFTDAMHHEPSGFVAAAYHAMHLQCTHSLLAGIEQVDREAPFAERYLATLAYGIDRDGELLAAGIALECAGTMG